MTRSKFAWTTMIAMVGMVAAATVVGAAELTQKAGDPAEATAADEVAASQAESCALGDDPVLEDVDGFKIRPTCLGSYPKTCDDYPVPQGGTCSCQSGLIQEKCINCDNHKEGRVLETTCTICGPCYSPPCIPTECNQRTSRTCSTF